MPVQFRSLTLTNIFNKDRARNDHVEGIDEAHIHHGKILRGWDAVDKRIRDSDESKVEDFKEDVDTLLVFVSTLDPRQDSYLTRHIIRLDYSLLLRQRFSSNPISFFKKTKLRPLMSCLPRCICILSMPPPLPLP